MNQEDYIAALGSYLWVTLDTIHTELNYQYWVDMWFNAIAHQEERRQTSAWPVIWPPRKHERLGTYVRR